jgi:hypothetical protein
VERFHGTALDEFFREAFRAEFYASVEEFQADFDTWLAITTTSGPIGAIVTWAEGRSRP